MNILNTKEHLALFGRLKQKWIKEEMKNKFLKNLYCVFSEEVLMDNTESDKLRPPGAYQISCGLLVPTSRHITLPMLRLLSSKAQCHKDF